jgi:MFS family permease
MPLLSIFFLTLPDTTAKQIGFYTGIGFIASLIFEIPSSYFADKVGHKITLITAKILMILSTLMFIFANSFWYFVIGSALLSLSFAFSGGVGSAFMYDTMRELKREKEYTKIMSKIGAYASLFSGILIILLPLLTTISILLPFKIVLIIDIMGLVAVYKLQKPAQEHDTSSNSIKEIIQIIKKAVRPGFYPLALFTGAISGFLVADGAYRYVYLQSLGYPIIFIGFVMGLSRFVWFLIAHNISYLEKISIHTIMTIELFLFPLTYLSVAYFNNPYIVGLLFSVVIGYQWARDQLYTSEFINKYISNKQYKATMLSVTTQVDYVIQMIIAFSVATLMEKSFKLGFYVLSIALFIVLFFAYINMPKTSQQNFSKL